MKLGQPSFSEFLARLLDALGVDTMPLNSQREADMARIFLDRANRYFYQEFSEGKVTFVSKFHQFWEAQHAEVVGPSLDRSQARKAAATLEDVFAYPEKFPLLVLKPPIQREGVSDQAVANVRFFTAIQDFKINIYREGRNPFHQYRLTPRWFTATELVGEPKLAWEFLQWLNATGSQGDKRHGWMVAAARFLVNNYGGDANHICEANGGDALAIRRALVAPGDIGYSEKKADMFMRDMADWGVWLFKKNFDKVNVASDANTMRIALRTGVLHTKMLLIASYLDVYCYQYGLIDEFTQLAWRAVWEEWGHLSGNHRPPTPASMDYLLYRSIGRQFCKPRNPKCGQCIFDGVCPPHLRSLKSPRSISRLGMTGWESGRTDEGGGGGIMS